jgi:hypothetical protein
MEQSEPANPRNPGDDRNAALPQWSAIAAETSGCCDLGMKREALRLVSKILAKDRILPEEFSEAVRTIGIHGSSFKKWKPKLEAAYNRQPREFKREVRPYMVELYGSLREWETTVRFLSVRKPCCVSEIFFGMEALLALDRFEDAGVLAGRCKRALCSATDRFEQSLLIEALASFFARTHHWGAAIELWQQAPLYQPFRRDALAGIVQLHLAFAYESIEIGLRKLSELKESPDTASALCLPGNDSGLTKHAEKALLKLKRGIEKLLPEKARKQLGMS